MSKINVKLDLTKLRCASCKEYLTNAPVFVQYNGDSVCGSCNILGGKASFRNTLYEDMMKGVLFPCRNASRGCTKQVGFNNTMGHEAACTYKDCYKCPIDTCKWSGKLEMLFSHFFQDGHNAAVLTNQMFIFSKNGQVFKLLQLKQRSFVLWVNAINQKVSIEIINLDFGVSVEYKLSIYKPNASEEGEIRKKGRTRVFNGKKEAIEFDKKLITEMLGKSEMLECSVFLVMKTDKNQKPVYNNPAFGVWPQSSSQYLS